jgi:hypothetical protein
MPISKQFAANYTEACSETLIHSLCTACANPESQAVYTVWAGALQNEAGYSSALLLPKRLHPIWVAETKLNTRELSCSLNVGGSSTEWSFLLICSAPSKENPPLWVADTKMKTRDLSCSLYVGGSSTEWQNEACYSSLLHPKRIHPLWVIEIKMKTRKLSCSLYEGGSSTEWSLLLICSASFKENPPLMGDRDQVED